ncbi:MAG: serine/threonine-protein kinase [Nannocystaceae bacterium]
MEGVLFFLIVFGSVTLWKHMGHRHRERMLELQRARPGAKDGSIALAAANEERLRQLESIVGTVEFELNTKLNRIEPQQSAASKQPALPRAAETSTGGSDASRRDRAGTGPRAGTFEPGQRVADRFVVGRVLGSGPKAALYLARDEKTSASVALKVVHERGSITPEALDLLRRETAAMRRVVHPNVVRTYDLYEKDGGIVLSTEFVAGMTLADLVERDGPLSGVQVAEILKQVSMGLEAAHAQDVVHLGLTPNKVRIKLERGQLLVKILDFGASALTFVGAEVTSLGKDENALAYAAPEQFRRGRVDGRADLYAAGALAYYALTGATAPVGWTPDEQGGAGSSVLPSPAAGLRSNVSEAWWTFIARALEKEPAKRYQSAVELRGSVPGTHPQ